jgi:hypothetical protein
MSLPFPTPPAPRRGFASQARMRPRLLAGLLAMGAVLSAPAQAQPELRVSGGVENTGHDHAPVQTFSVSDNSGLPYVVSSARLTGSNSTGGVCSSGGTAGAGAAAAPGYLRLATGANGFAICDGTVSGWASASYSDSFEVTGGVGFLGVRDFTWDLAHVIGVGPANVIGPAGVVGAQLQGFISIDDGVQAVTLNFGAGAQQTGNGFTFFDTIPDSVTIPWALWAGRTITKTVSISGFSTVADSGIFTTSEFTQASGSAIASFPSSFHWQGFELLPGESVVGSTIDWSLPAAVVSVPIPEPRTWALMLLGLAVLAARRSRASSAEGRAH